MPVDPGEPRVAGLVSPARVVDLSRQRTVHVIGIGGTGMRAIAGALIDMGHRVQGSDAADSRWIAALRDRGATVAVGHDAAQIAGAELVVRSTAVPDTNVEVQAALGAGLDVLSRAELLAAMTSTRESILIAGTHGKTTTSSMLAVLLDHAGREPSFVVGADLARFGTGARWADGTHAVIEADESDATFLLLPGRHAIVTSLDPDHLDTYGTSQRLSAAFGAFVEAIPGVVVVCADDDDTGHLLSIEGTTSYGSVDGCDLRFSAVRAERGASSFEVTWREVPLGRVSIGLPGRHNVLNACAALAMALELGVDFGDAAAGLAAFDGVGRRFEHRGEIAGVTFVDDYAHLPAEVEAALEAATAGEWERIVCTYQPHRYTRTRDHGADFRDSFRQADRLVLTDIYPSGETPIPGVDGRILFDAVTARDPDADVVWQPTLDDVTDHLAATLRPGDLCLTLGAGDLTSVADRVIERLRPSRPSGNSAASELAGVIDLGRIWEDERLAPRTTYRVGGPARVLVDVESLEELRHAGQVARDHGLEVAVVGRGSNLLVSDRGFDGMVIVLGEGFTRIEIVESTPTRVRLGGAVAIPVAARKLTRAGLTGFEWAVGVPGSAGGAVVMNAGGHGSDMNASTVSATILDVTTGVVTERSAADLSFGYRRSSVSATECVVAVTLELDAGDPVRGDDALREIVRWRREHQPGGQNAGSVFTNPEGDAAGRLIDVAGGKGRRVGSAEVSTKHANFIQVDPGGSGDDVAELMIRVRELVAEHSGVVLQTETRLLGFDPDRAQTLRGEHR